MGRRLQRRLHLDVEIHRRVREQGRVGMLIWIWTERVWRGDWGFVDGFSIGADTAGGTAGEAAAGGSSDEAC